MGVVISQRAFLGIYIYVSFDTISKLVKSKVKYS